MKYPPSPEERATLHRSANWAVSQMMEQYARAQRSAVYWYRPSQPLTRYEHAWRRVKAWGRWPFERLRDALVNWLGCDCDPY